MKPRHVLVVSLLVLLMGAVLVVVRLREADRPGATDDARGRDEVATHAPAALGGAVNDEEERIDEPPEPPGTAAPIAQPAEEQTPRAHPLSESELARARKLARAAVERVRDSTHRNKTTIVWPDSVPVAPADGAELLVLTGYRDYELLHIVWRGGVATGRSTSTSRGGAVELIAPALAARAFTVAPDDFRAAWAATQLIRGARAERNEPREPGAPPGESGRHSNREPYVGVRLREQPGGPDVHFAAQRGQAYGPDRTRRWDEIQHLALHAMAHDIAPPRIPAADWGAPVPIAQWTPFVNETLTEWAHELEGDERTEYSKAHNLLRHTTLVVAGDAGDGRTLELLDALARDMQEPTSASPGRARPRESFDGAYAMVLGARLRVGLRLHWEPERARTLLAGGTPELVEARVGRDFFTWLRALYAERDPEGYLDLIVERARSPGTPSDVLQLTVIELESRFGERGAAALTEILSSGAPRARVSAALALLRLGRPEAALPVLRDVATDTTIRRRMWGLSRGWSRWDAIAALIECGEWDVARMRRQVDAPGEDGLLIQKLDAALADHGAPLTDVERRDAYRRVLDGPSDGGLLVAIEALVRLDDHASYERMAALLEALAQPAAEGEDDPVGQWHRRRTIPRLRNALSN